MRDKFKKYYENLIDDIADEEKREQLLDKLEELDDMIFELDYEIKEEIENQESNYIEDEIGNDYELYLRTVRAWIFTRNCQQ